MADNVTIIADFLRKHGFSDPAIAGILGNWQIESGFNPTRENTSEGAIGLAQWEGGRRRNLDAYATSSKGSETSLVTQLNYFLQELRDSYPNVYSELKTVKSPGEAAAYFDANYEISSGAARQERIDAANFFAAHGFSGGPSVSGGSSGSTIAQPAGWNIPTVPGQPLIGGFNWILHNPVNSVKDGWKSFAGSMAFISEFFQKLVWIFQPNHFIKFMLYLGGITFVIAGIFMIVYGSGKERPA